MERRIVSPLGGGGISQNGSPGSDLHAITTRSRPIWPTFDKRNPQQTQYYSLVGTQHNIDPVFFLVVLVTRERCWLCLPAYPRHTPTQCDTRPYRAEYYGAITPSLKID
jgi:hypothetical protein